MATDRTAEDVIAKLRKHTDVWDILDLEDARLLLAHIDAIQAKNARLRVALTEIINLDAANQPRGHRDVHQQIAKEALSP